MDDGEDLIGQVWSSFAGSLRVLSRTRAGSLRGLIIQWDDQPLPQSVLVQRFREWIANDVIQRMS